MSKLISYVNEGVVEEVSTPGEDLKWFQTPEMTGGRYTSICRDIYEPGCGARRGHSHDHGEETIYIARGTGVARVGDEIFRLEPGALLLFPQGVPHRVWNNGTETLELVCFYANGPEARECTMFDDFPFPEGLI